MSNFITKRKIPVRKKIIPDKKPKQDESYKSKEFGKLQLKETLLFVTPVYKQLNHVGPST